MKMKKMILALVAGCVVLGLQAGEKGQQKAVSLTKIAIAATLGLVEGYGEYLLDQALDKGLPLIYVSKGYGSGMRVPYMLPGLGMALKILTSYGIGAYFGKEAGMANGLAGGLMYLVNRVIGRTENPRYLAW